MSRYGSLFAGVPAQAKERLREIIRVLRDEAKATDLSVEHDGKGHIVVNFMVDGWRGKARTASSPGDAKRALQQARGEARGAVRIAKRGHYGRA